MSTQKLSNSRERIAFASISGFLMVGVARMVFVLARGSWEESPEKAGQLGDTLGGFANFVTMLIVAASALYATRQIAQFRQQHDVELLAASALRIWACAYRYGLSLTRELDLAGRGLSPSPRNREWDRASEGFDESFAEAQMMFQDSPSLIDELKTLDTAHREIREIREPISRSPQETHVELRARLVALREKILGTLDAIRTSLTEHARPGGLGSVSLAESAADKGVQGPANPS